MTDALTAFDAVAITLVILSALMALARGFVRELTTLGAFILALGAAYVARGWLRDPVSGLFSADSPAWLADVSISVIVFISVYAVVAWLGQRLSRNIQGVDGIGLIDRVSGFAFGVARGGVAVVFFVYLLQLGMDRDRIPEWISAAQTYPFFANAADYVNENAPKLAQDMREALPEAATPDNS